MKLTKVEHTPFGVSAAYLARMSANLGDKKVIDLSNGRSFNF